MDCISLCTENPVLLFKSMQMVTLARLQLSPPPIPPACPTPVDSIRDITGTEKNYPSGIQLMLCSILMDYSVIP